MKWHLELIDKWTTFVVKPKFFIKPRNYQDPTFYLGIHSLPKSNQYTYLRNIIRWISRIKIYYFQNEYKNQLYINSFFRFLTNKNIPYYFKFQILISFVLSTVLYYAPLLGSNKSYTKKKAQSAFNRGMFWSSGFKNLKSNTSLFNMSKELCIPSITCFCDNAMIRWFNKWKNSSCIIADLVNNIPTLSYCSWSKKSLIIKLLKINLLL